MKELTITIAGKNVNNIIYCLSELQLFLNEDQLKLPYSERFMMSNNEIAIHFEEYETDYPRDQVNF